MLCAREDDGRVKVEWADEDGIEVGNLRKNVERYCSRVGITDPALIEVVHGKWREREEAGERASGAEPGEPTGP